jgi:hypothetical protein
MLLLGASSALGELPLSDLFELDRVDARRASLLDGISAEIEWHLARERVIG